MLKSDLLDTLAFDYARCCQCVRQYLTAQGWQLADPLELASQIWQDLSAPLPSESTAVKAIQTQVWQRYAVFLHENCRQPGSDRCEQAWTELYRWLRQQAHRFTADRDEQDSLVQLAISDLQARLEQSPLKAPRALWAYALQTMRAKMIDEHRRRTAVMRGDGLELSLEEISAGQSGPAESDWEEHISDHETSERSVEDHVANEQVRQQLRDFFRTHLATDLQLRVAEEHFLNGLSPQEIARLLGKKPHEIRMIKARIVQTLHHLPPEAHRKLLDILGLPPGEDLC